jgi:hypothetical protein
MKKKSISDRLQELKFYMPNDEAGELFAATCTLCYKMYGMGETRKAELLYTWAKEQAEYNLKWCENEGFDISSEDYVTGGMYT